ncbi:MAG TPA: hypothetical protein VN108_03725 [Marmoricola sp.]|nr:hypothetical protein [Marmoricola sp.]
MAAKVTYKAGPFPDRRAQYTAEIARVRLVAASATRVVFGVVAVFFALGALMSVANDYISSTNPLVQFVFNVDTWFQGPFSRDAGVFSFTGANAERLNAIVNWGLASVVYSAIGSLLRSLMRPHGHFYDDESLRG